MIFKRIPKSVNHYQTKHSRIYIYNVHELLDL